MEMGEIMEMFPGDTLMREGDPSDSIFQLRSGKLKVLVGRQQVGEVKIGELVGEMAFMNSAPRSATVVAASQCELIKISRESFEAALKGLPPWLYQYVHTLTQRVRDAARSG